MHNSVAKKENMDHFLAPRKRNRNIYEYAEEFFISLHNRV